MKRDWWKYLGVLIFIYVLSMGLLIPLRPGIVNVSPSTANSGSQLTLDVQTYNSNFNEAQNSRAWLKFQDDIIIESDRISVINSNDLKLDFNIPGNLNFDKDYLSASLILDNEMDAYSLLPDAVTILKSDSIVTTNNNLVSISDLHSLDAIRFPYRNILVETIRNTFFHVAIWMAMFIILTGSLIFSIKYLRKPSMIYDFKASAMAEVGIVFGFIGLATGSVWAKYTWGAFWTADVKLNLSAVAILIYLAYWILRGSIKSIDSRARISAAYNIFAFLMMIPLMLILPRMTDSLHPGNGGNPALGGEDLDNTLRMVFYPSIIALTLIGFWLAQMSWRLKTLALDKE